MRENGSKTASAKAGAFIDANGLLSGVRGVVAALSGGADSVCLLLMLAEMARERGFKLCAAHVNHNVRERAKDDENFCVGLCERLDVPIKVYDVDMTGFARDGGLTAEEAGRVLRYKAFDDAVSAFGADVTAVAHNMDDQGETILMNLCRGAGLRGLSGMAAKSGGIIRPLLCLTRAEIEGYLTEVGQSWREDETNASDLYTRNFFRNAVIPPIKARINASLTETLSRTAGILREDGAFLDALSESAFDDCREGCCGRGVNAAKMAGLPPPLSKRVATLMYKEAAGTLKDLTAKQIGDIMSVAEGVMPRASLAGGHAAERAGNAVIITKSAIDSGGFCYALNVGESVYVAETGYAASLSRDCEEGGLPFRAGSFALRTRRGGDYITLEKVGRKKVKDFFIDRKTPRIERDVTPILTIDGAVVWIAGNEDRNAFVDRRFEPKDDEARIYFYYKRSE